MNDYPPEWPTIAHKVKVLASYRCERCGSESVPGRILTVHHLSGRKADCRYENLVALCQVCHLVIQARYRPGQTTFEPEQWMLSRGLA